MPFTEFYGATFGPNRQPRAKAKILWGAANTQLGPYRVSTAARHGQAGVLIVRIQSLWEGFTEGMNEFDQCFTYRNDTAEWWAEKSNESVLQGRPKKNCGTRPQERPSRWFGTLNFETIASDLANLEPYFGQSTLRIQHSQSTHIRNFL